MITLYDSSGTKLYDLDVTDDSYSNAAIMSDNQLTLNFSSTDYYDIPVGAYCSFGGTKYTLKTATNFTKHGTRNFEYTVVMDVDGADLKNWMVRDSDGRLSFSYTGTPAEILQFLVDNCNRHTTGWTMGNCIVDDSITVNFSHTYISDALKQLADTEETEYEIKGKVLSLWKVKYNVDSPITLQYGEGNAFKVDVKREKTDTQIDVLLPETTDRNIDYSKTGHKELLLPLGQTLGYDGTYFDNETGYNSSKARTYKSSADGYSIMRSDNTNSNGHEDGLDCTTIYPSRIGTVSAVSEVDRNGHLYDIIDSSIPDDLNFANYMIDGDNMTVVFQSGMLAGKEFDVSYYHTVVGSKAAKRFELVAQTFDGITMPDYGTGYLPAVGDKYIVFGVQLPDAYICDNTTKTGASWDVFRKCVKYMFDHEDKKYTFSGSINPVWAHRRWDAVGGKFVLGGYAQIVDEQFMPDGTPVRITSIKQYINHPYRPELTLSNDVTSGSATTAIQKAENQDVTINYNYKQSVRYTNRRFRDAQETMSMLSAAIDNFSTAVNPISVQTMALLVGDESLQFEFVNQKTDPITQIAHSITYDSDTKILHSDAGIIQHMTLGISSLSSSHAASEYKFWTMSAYDSPALDDGTIAYYLYAKCSKTDGTGTFLLSATAIKLEAVDGYYHLLVGILNSEYNSTRSFVTMYGYTEITPGRMTVDKVVSSDGLNFFDFLNSCLKFGDDNCNIDINTKGDHKIRFKGVAIQSPSGDEAMVGCFRGLYSGTIPYYLGDTVTYSSNGNTSTYRYINDSSAVGKVPGTDTDYWTLVAQGDTGNYTEYRYATNGSGTVAPSITTTDDIPSGWSLTLPSITLYQYMWVTTAIKTASGRLVGSWSTPQRFSGAQGANGPAPTYAGNWSASGTYYGTSLLVSVVKYSNVYYMARYDVGASFTCATTPDNDTTHWTNFGSNFISVATGLLLAEEAYIDNLIVSRLATSSNPYAFMLATLDAALGIFRNKADSSSISNALIALGKDISEMQETGQQKPAMVVRDAQWKGLYNNSVIYYKDDRVYYSTTNMTYIFNHDWAPTETPVAGLLPTNNTYWGPLGSGNLGGGKYSELGSEGIFSNGSNVSGISAGANATLAMLLQKRNSDKDGFSAAILGLDQTSDSDDINASKSYGGYFNRLYIQSELDNIFVTSDSANLTLDKSSYHVIHYYGANDKSVYLPVVNYRDKGLKFWFRKMNAGNLIIHVDSGHDIINAENNSVSSIVVAHGQRVIIIWDGSHWIFNYMN